MAPLRCAPEFFTRDLSGKDYLITGANSGIGLFTTLQLVRQGAHVIMGCRRVEEERALPHSVRGELRPRGHEPTSRPGIDLDHLKWEKRGYKNMDAYHSSKLANLLHARALAKQLDGSGVTAVSVHPGWVRTNLARHLMPKFVQNIVMMPLYGYLGFIDDGSQTTFHTLLDDDIPNHAGEYFAQSGNLFHNPKSKAGGWPLTSTNPNAHDHNLTEQLYLKSRTLAGLE